MLIVHSTRVREHVPARFVVAGTQRPHPDVPERIDSLLSGIASPGFERIEPADHGLQYLRRIHSDRYLDFLEHAHEAWLQLPAASPEVLPNVHPRGVPGEYPRSIIGRAGWHLYDLSCPIAAPTWRAVVWNAHVATEAALRVRDGAARCAYALCRPPGHHAGADQAGGFCYLNNAAVAATVLRERFARVAILDVDVHHGNGTQDIFYDRADVLFASLHGDPASFYPFYWGYAAEQGSGAGFGATLNVPLARELRDDEYLAALLIALERIRAFGAEALVVSVGFDGYERDPLSSLKLSTEGFGRIAAAIAGLKLPSVLVQEGGYFCADLGRNLAAFLHGFLAGLDGARGAAA
ncbi:MAG TPA: histone deacetylase family protein [Steroidobacteraceae bacterium]|nr:histone deacetylase family protein [Steroidobacteraceae bacterium]